LNSFKLGLEVRADVSANLFKSLQVRTIEDFSAPLGHKDPHDTGYDGNPENDPDDRVKWSIPA
jgi:hypothetical protein